MISLRRRQENQPNYIEIRDLIRQSPQLECVRIPPASVQFQPFILSRLPLEE